MYPSAEILLIQWTAARFPDSRVVSETPANLQEVLGTVDSVIRIQRFGGADDELTLDRASLDVDVFATSWPAADLIGGQVRVAWRTEMPGATIDVTTHGRAVVARVVTTSGPSRRPVTDPDLARCGLSFSVHLHSA